MLRLIFVCWLALLAPIAFCAAVWFAARLEGKRRYRAVLVASLGYVGLAGVVMYIMLMLESGPVVWGPYLFLLEVFEWLARFGLGHLLFPRGET
jgi:hypothetical protein